MNKKLTTAWQGLTAYLIGSRHSGDGSAFEARLRRWLILLPLAGTALLLVWTHLVREPRMQNLRGQNQDLIVLEQSIKEYRLRLSDQQFSDLLVRRRDAELFILPDAAATARLLAQLLDSAAAAGWSVTTEPEPPVTEVIAAEPELALGHQSLRLSYGGKDAAAAVPRLLVWLEQLPALDKRMDVVDLTIEHSEPALFQASLRLQFIQRAQP